LPAKSAQQKIGNLGMPLILFKPMCRVSGRFQSARCGVAPFDAGASIGNGRRASNDDGKRGKKRRFENLQFEQQINL
jgi:hypothetical protein